MVAFPDILDPMYWLGADGVFGSAVLPGILVIVFIETGLLFPLLPGESLLFTGGLLAAHPNPPASIWVLAPCVAVVAVLGDQTGYFIGRRIGPALFKKEDSRFFKRHYVHRVARFLREIRALGDHPGSVRAVRADVRPGRRRGVVYALSGIPWVRHRRWYRLGRRRDAGGLLPGHRAVRVPQPGKDHPGHLGHIVAAGDDRGLAWLPGTPARGTRARPSAGLRAPDFCGTQRRASRSSGLSIELCCTASPGAAEQDA